MGHIKINNLSRSFIERRHNKRNKGNAPEFGEEIKVLDDIKAAVRDEIERGLAHHPAAY